MRKIWVVAHREFIARVRTRGFIIATILFPVMIAAFAILPAMFSRSTNRTLRIGIVDATGDSVGGQVELAIAALRLQGDSAAAPRYRVTRVVATPTSLAHIRDSLIAHTGVSTARDADPLDGVLVLGDSMATTGRARYYGTNTSAFEIMGELENTISQALMGHRLRAAGIDPQVMAGVMRPASVATIKVSDGKATGESGTASFIVAYIMGFILYFAMIIYGQQTLTSVIEEKTSRIMEVLTSSVRPFEMLLGKILGVGSVGLFQLAIWGGSIVLIGSQRVAIAHALGMSTGALQQSPIPSMPPALLGVFLLYFILGFLLYGAVYAAVGSMYNVVRDAQQGAMFVTMIIVVGFVMLFAVMKDPTGSLAVTASIVPFVSPFIMPARWSLATVPTGQLVVSIAFAVLALLAVTWVAARIYRTGILMYGKKPSLVEVFRWVRAG